MKCYIRDRHQDDEATTSFFNFSYKNVAVWTDVLSPRILQFSLFNFYTNQVLFHENTLKRASSLRHRQTAKDQKTKWTRLKKVNKS